MTQLHGVFRSQTLAARLFAARENPAIAGVSPVLRTEPRDGDTVYHMNLLDRNGNAIPGYRLESFINVADGSYQTALFYPNGTRRDVTIDRDGTLTTTHRSPQGITSISSRLGEGRGVTDQDRDFYSLMRQHCIARAAAPVSGFTAMV
jgi:hypothetical protein